MDPWVKCTPSLSHPDTILLDWLHVAKIVIIRPSREDGMQGTQNILITDLFMCYFVYLLAFHILTIIFLLCDFGEST